IGIWNLVTGHLLHVFEAPPASWADNAALAFSPDSKRLAFAGSSETVGRARLWELATGKVQEWEFAPGLNNILAFQPANKLLLLQIEDEGGKHLRSRVPDCRVRDLLGGEPQKAMDLVKGFDHIDSPVAPEDGRFLVVVGIN